MDDWFSEPGQDHGSEKGKKWLGLECQLRKVSRPSSGKPIYWGYQENGAVLQAAV